MGEYKPRTEMKKKMYEQAGARERYAMENGHSIRFAEGGRRLVRFVYSKYDPYQDANGATYDLEAKRWVN